MTRKRYNSFKTRKWNLICRTCDCPIDIGDEVESKSGGRRKNGSLTGPKLYHAECYDRAHYEFDDDHNIFNGLGNLIEVEKDEKE